MTTPVVFVINSGSSSVKYQLVDPKTGQALASGLAERIGEADGHIKHKYGDEVVEEHLPLADHAVALRRVIEIFETVGPKLSQANVVGVGHRVVQGGSFFDGPALVDEKVHQQIAELCPLAPLHNPANLRGVDVARELWPDLPHVVVFDSAFFAHLPEAAARYALNREVADKYQVRRYGAHGTSHQYVSGLVCDMLGEDIKQITLHMGNGASVCAEAGRVAQDTSMGLTPLEGLVMGTRTGDIDPAVVFHLLRQGMNVDEVDNLFNKQSGMKGLCGDNDMREVHRRIAEGEEDARVAMDIYLHRLLKYVGAYTAVLGGLDALTFTAGIGENDAQIRADLCAKLGWLGVKLDEEANQVRSDEPRVVSTPDSAVKVLVVPTNEELAIARQVVEVSSKSEEPAGGCGCSCGSK